MFIFWALWFWAWTFATLVGLNARAASVRTDLFDVDPQQVEIMVLSVSPPSSPPSVTHTM